jgi:hypothetical protein
MLLTAESPEVKEEHVSTSQDHTSISSTVQLSNEEQPEPPANTQRQLQLLEDVLSATDEHMSLAESMVGDLYTLAQRLHLSGSDILYNAERINALVMFARQWRATITTYRLLVEEEQKHFPVIQSAE